eukprot:Skav203962  [mRNA]  locus=scaffold94:67359:71867:+ [translate_table: standard]
MIHASSCCRTLSRVVVSSNSAAFSRSLTRTTDWNRFSTLFSGTTWADCLRNSRTIAKSSCWAFKGSPVMAMAAGFS